MDRDLVMKNI